MTAPSFYPGSQTIAVMRAVHVTESRHGATRRDWASAQQRAVHGCDVQPISTLTAQEDDVDREYIATHLRLFAPANADLEATDRVLWSGQTFEIDGPPHVWRGEGGRPHHIEAELKRLTG
jgi:hypothetical protein